MRASRAILLAAISGVLCGACSPIKGNTGSAANGGDKSEAGSRAAGSGGAAGDDEPEQHSSESGRSGSGGSGGAGGSSGASGKGVIDSSAGAKSSGSMAGAGGGQAGASGSGPEPQSMEGPGAGTPSSGGGSGNVEPTPGAVRGTLIDALKRPLADVELHVGNKTVTTDKQGKFTVDRMSDTYDVSFKLTTIVDEKDTTYAWRFVGLTRRDPTLQVYVASEQHLGSLTWHTQGPTFPFAESTRMLAGFGSPDGNFTVGVNTADYDSPLVYWSGPQTTTGTTHGLLFTVSGASELPVQYLAHDAKPLTLTAGGKANANFNLSGAGLPTFALTGRVTAPGQGTRENWVMLRWTDGTTFLVASDSPTADTFSYLVPTIEGATASVLAFRGRSNAFPVAVAYADHAAGGQAMQLDIPLPPTLSAPGAGMAGVTGETEFKWTGDAKLFVFVARATERYDAMFVVTGEKSTKLPIGDLTAFTPGAGSEFAWHIETHGDYASVDAATGGEGFIASFLPGGYDGPHRGSGSFSASATRTFVTPP